MERNKIIAVVILSIGIIAWRMGAMEGQPNATIALITKDGKSTSIPRNSASFFGTIKDLMADLPDVSEMPLKNIERQEVLLGVINDLKWVIDTLAAKAPSESDEQAVKRAIDAMPIPTFDQVVAENLIDKASAAYYLGQKQLIERYQRAIRGLIKTPASFEMLANNNRSYASFMERMEKLPYTLLDFLADSINQESYWFEALTLNGHKDGVNTARFSPDETRVVTASRDGMAKIWDAKTGAPILTLQHHEKESDELVGADFSKDGSIVLTTSLDGTAKMWDARTGAALHQLSGIEFHTTAKFCSNGSKVIAACDNGRVKIWDVEKGEMIRELKRDKNITDPVELMSASPDGKVAVLRVSPDESKIATVWKGENVLTIWDAQTGAKLNVLSYARYPRVQCLDLSFSFDGNKIAMMVWQEVGINNFQVVARIWNLVNGQEERTLGLETNDTMGDLSIVNKTEFCQDGSKLVTVSYNDVRIWNTNMDVPFLVLPQESGRENRVQAIAFSSDGKRLVTGSRNNLAKIWDTAGTAQQEPITLKGDTDTIWSVVFSKDGNQVLTGSLDHTAKIFVALPRNLPGMGSDFATLYFTRVLLWAQDNNQKISKAGWMGNMIRRIIWSEVDPLVKKEFQRLMREAMQQGTAQ